MITIKLNEAKNLHKEQRPINAADIVALRTRNNKFEVLLGERKFAPLGWALPGGFQEYNESLEATASRELHEETGYKVDPDRMRLVTVKSNPDRDPRRHVNSIVYKTWINSEDEKNKDSIEDDLKSVRWFTIEEARSLDLVCDHMEIILGVFWDVGF